MRRAKWVVYGLLVCLLSVTTLAAAFDVNSPRVAFVTSATYTGNLGGLAGADALCQAAASAGGLSDPSSFAAWLSDASTDAYCHVHGFGGTKADNCGQPSLPVAVGPWVRMDGFPFAGSIDEMLEPINRVIAPVFFDEFAVALGQWEGFWTATKSDGEHAVGSAGDCNSWTTGADIGTYATDGYAWTTAERWTNSGGRSCDAPAHLLCLGTGAAAPLPHHSSGGALAFVTAAMGTGDLSSWPLAGGASGVAAGDSICQQEASAAGLPSPDSFVAWLSTGAVNAVDRLTLDGPWIRPDGVTIAVSKADLIDGQLLVPLNVDSAGTYVGPYGVWTGTDTNGQLSSANCSNWSTTAGDGIEGVPVHMNSYWTKEVGPLTCSYPAGRLYCFSNVVTWIFRDDFESGATDGWTLSSP